MSVDLTVIVTARDETAVCGPTMAVTDRAIALAREAGLTVQPVVVCDGAHEATVAYFGQPRFDHWERHVLSGAGPGHLAPLLREVEGRLVTVVVAGDLVSENWLVAGVTALEEAQDGGERAVAHPELRVTFDGAREVGVALPQDSALFTPHLLYFAAHHGGPCLAPRQTYVDHPALAGPFPHEALHAEVATLEAGWCHVLARDTIHFRRAAGTVASKLADVGEPLSPALPGMAIDRVRDLGRRTAP